MCYKHQNNLGSWPSAQLRGPGASGAAPEAVSCENPTFRTKDRLNLSRFSAGSLLLDPEWAQDRDAVRTHTRSLPLQSLLS